MKSIYLLIIAILLSLISANINHVKCNLLNLFLTFSPAIIGFFAGLINEDKND